MNITNYIVEFLKQGNPVEIKGIGTFSSKTTPSYFDEETKKYFPSVRTVVFSNSWKGDTQIINYNGATDFSVLVRTRHDYLVFKNTSKQAFTNAGLQANPALNSI